MPPDEFERRRNHTIYSRLQSAYHSNNRNPFVDRPEYRVVDLCRPVERQPDYDRRRRRPDGNGGSTRNVDLGRVFVGGAVPAAQSFTLNKAGNDGTYYEVTTAGAATSSLSGRYNAFRMDRHGQQVDQRGLNTNTATAGLRSGTVTVDNLDITTAVRRHGLRRQRRERHV